MLARSFGVRAGACAAVVALAMPALALAQTPQTLYVNFDGVTLTQGPDDDARNNVTYDGRLVGEYPPFTADATERDAIVQTIRGHMEPFEVAVVTERPASGGYDMAIVSPRKALGNTLGWGEMDCGDHFKNNVVFTFVSPGELNALQIANVVSQEVGHAWGLEHSGDQADLMVFGGSLQGQATFLDECTAISGAPLFCRGTHDPCPEGEQNSFAEIMSVAGPRGGASETGGVEETGDSEERTSGEGGDGDTTGASGATESGTGVDLETTSFGTSGASNSDGGGCRVVGGPPVALSMISLLGLLVVRRRR